MNFKNLNKHLKFNANDSDAIFNDKYRAIKAYRLMQWAKWATFGLYLVAVFMLYVSDIWGITSYIEQKSNDWVALIVFSVIAFTLSYFLAFSKESSYEDIALHRAEGYRLTPAQWFILSLYLSSGLLFELFSTSSNQQHIANAAAENSAMFKSVTASTPTLSVGSAALVTQLQEAEKRLAACEVKLSQGKVKDCAQSQANVQAVKTAMDRADALAQQTNAAALDAKTEAMLKVREHYDKSIYQVAGKAVGGDNNTGMIIVIAVLIFIFEVQHIIAMITYSNALRRLKLAGAHPADASPVGVAPALAAFADNLQDSPKAQAIATEYARANSARRELYQAAADKLDTLENADAKKRFYALLYAEAKARLNNGVLELTQPALENLVNEIIAIHARTLGLKADISKATTAVLAKHLLNKLGQEVNTSPTLKPATANISDDRPFYGFKDPKKQAALDALNLATGSEDRKTWEQRTANAKTYRQALRDGEKVTRDMPLDAPVNRPATVPAQSEQLGTEAQQNTVPAQAGVNQTEQELTAGAKQVEADLYAEWLATVKAGQITASARDCKQFISKRTKNKDAAFGITAPEMGRIWLSWQDRAAQDGVLKPNPKYQMGNRQPKYILA